MTLYVTDIPAIPKPEPRASVAKRANGVKPMKYLLLLVACLLAAPVAAKAPNPKANPTVPVADLQALLARESCAIRAWGEANANVSDAVHDANRAQIEAVTIPVNAARQAQYSGGARAFAEAKAKAELGLRAFPGC